MLIVLTCVSKYHCAWFCPGDSTKNIHFSILGLPKVSNIENPSSTTILLFSMFKYIEKILYVNVHHQMWHLMLMV